MSVLRCKKGDELLIFDGQGTCFRTRIAKAERKEILAEIIETLDCDTESRVHVVLVQALLKGEKMDMVIQKATELGVQSIIPVVTERSQVKETRKILRWRKIAEEASRQSGRSIVPEVREADAFVRFIMMREGAEIRGRGLMFCEKGGISLPEAVASLVPITLSVFIMIGPEGGFTQNEINLAGEKGAIATTLGRRILRAETAAISAVSLVQFLFGGLE